MFYHIVVRLQYNKPSSKTLSETTSFADIFFYVLNIRCHWTTATVHVLYMLSDHWKLWHQTLQINGCCEATKKFYPQNF
jgi:hypothetical protein